MKAISIIINPASGRSKSRDVVAGLRRRAQRAGVACELRRTTGPGDAARFAREACERGGADALVVVGGDGTVSEAAGGVGDADVPILVAASGTENILAKYLGIRAEAEALWQILRDRQTVTFDTGLMNQRRFLLVAGVGFDAEVVRRLSEARKGHIGYVDYFWPLWQAFWSYRQPYLYVEDNDRLVFEGPGMAFVGNVPRYAIGLRILERADPSDGMLDVCVMRCAGRARLLRHALSVLVRRHTLSPEVLYFQTKRARIWSRERVPVELDGDFWGELPATFEIRPRTNQFLVPRRA